MRTAEDIHDQSKWNPWGRCQGRGSKQGFGVAGRRCAVGILLWCGVLFMLDLGPPSHQGTASTNIRPKVTTVVSKLVKCPSRSSEDELGDTTGDDVLPL